MFIYVITTIITGLFLYSAQYCFVKHKMNIFINEDNVGKKHFSLYFTISLFFLVISFQIYFLIGSLRFGVGTDFFGSYMDYFKDTLLSKEGEMREIGFKLLVKTIVIFTNNPQWLFVMTSFLFNIFVYFMIIRFANCWALAGMLAMICGFFFDDFNNIRQGIALVSGVCGLLYSTERKYGRGVLLLAFAFSFHRSVLTLVPLYLFAGIKPFRKLFYVFVLVLLVLTPFYLDWVKFLLEDTQYSWFLFSKQTEMSLHYFLVIQIPIFTFVILNYSELSEKHESFFILGIANTLALIVSILMFQLPIIETMFRAYRWFSWTPLLIIPYMLDIDAPFSTRLIYVITSTSIIISQNYIVYFILCFNEIYPYHFYYTIGEHVNTYFTNKQQLIITYQFNQGYLQYI